MLLDDAVRALSEDEFAAWYDGLSDAQQQQFKAELKEVFTLAVEALGHIVKDVPGILHQALETMGDLLTSQFSQQQ
ncbi:MAG: hypothetical protein FOGNACKC_00854 [Anaerolineae bacterium]|nr:hypothetical protein [Anaerolineae bacterium]